MNYQEALHYLDSFTNYEQLPAQAYAAEKFDLKRVEMLLHQLGDPHLGRITVHIAGTKGKGSAAAMMASVLGMAGYRTGLLTSPHLCNFRERIRLDGSAISESVLAELVEQVKPMVEAYHVAPVFGKLTTFELVTVVALLYFQQCGATAQVLEVGLGGRLDATNVVPKPDLCFITPVSYDHMEVLGTTLTAIAREKAGIIKQGVPLVMAPQENEARAVIAARCYELDAPLVDVDRRTKWIRINQTLEGQSFEVRGLRTGFKLWTCLLGAVQMENAATVVAGFEVLRELGMALPRGAVEEGIARVTWPGRLQVLAEAPLLLLDGAHNGASARRLREALQEDFPHRRVILVVGSLADKDIQRIASELAPVADQVITARLASPRSADPLNIAGAFARYGVPAEPAKNVADALDAARAAASPVDLICATGSLYLVGEVLAQLRPSGEALDIFLSKEAYYPRLAGVYV